MAIITVSNSGGTRNWTDPLTWVGGVVPLSTDSVIFTFGSGNLIINTLSTIVDFDLTFFIGTITFNGELIINGNWNLGEGSYTQAGASPIRISGTGTIISNGVTWSRRMRFSGSGTTTLLDDLNLSGVFTFQISGGPINRIINGYNIYHTGTFLLSTNGGVVSGTTKYWYQGTGTTWAQGISTCSINIDFYVDTVGTLTLSGSSGITFGGNKELKIINGSLNTSSLAFLSLNGRTIDFNGVTVNNLNIINTNQTVTLLTPTTVNTLTLYRTTTIVQTINGFNIDTNNLSITGTGTSTSITQGNTNINLIGTGTWSQTGTGSLRNNVTLNTPGTLTISGTVYYNTGTLTYTAGTVDTTGSTFICSGVTTINSNGNITSTSTINSTGINFNNFNTPGGLVTNATPIRIIGTWTHLYNCTGVVYVNGSLVVTSNSVGTGTSITLNGTGSWSGTPALRNVNLIIDTLGTINITTNVSVSGSTITYIQGTVNTTGSTLTVSTSSTFDTIGMTWNNFTSAIATITLTSNLNCVNLTTTGGYSSVTINGSNVNVSGNLNIGGRCAGTATVVLNGTGIWSDSGFGITINLTINTSGTITISGTIFYTTGTLLYVANVGTVITTGSTLYSTGSVTWNTNGITWNNVTFGGGIQTVLSAFTLSGNLGLGGYSNVTINGSNVNVGGNLTCGSLTSGNATVILNGTGIWTTSNTFAPNLTINTAGTITISGTVYYNIGTLTYIAGTVITTSSTLILSGSCTLDTKGSTLSTATTISNTGINFNAISFSYITITITNNSPLCIISNLSLYSSNINDNTGTSGASTYLLGNLYIPYIGSGSSKIIFNGLGSQSWTHAPSYINPSNSYGASYHYIINKPSGTLTFGAQIGLGVSSILDYIQGTVDTTTNSSTLYIWTVCTLNTNGINWNNIVIINATIANNSLLTCNSLTLGNTGINFITFSGTSGFTTGSLSVTTPGRIITLASGITYNVTNNLNIVGSTASRITIRSLTTPRAIFTLPYGATQNVQNTNATNIDSSLGQTIRSSFGDLSNTINWELGQGSWITMMKPQYHV